MKKTVLTFGLIGGLMVGAMLFITVPMYNNGTLNFDIGEVVGFSTMIVALSVVFFGVRSYRNQHMNGIITFGQALKVGLLISLIAALVYAISWEICYRTIASDFIEKYNEHSLESYRLSGLSETELLAKQQEMKTFAEQYKNPFIRFGMTMMEIFPVGLIMSLISALVFKKKVK